MRSAASICPFEGFLQYLATMDVAVAMSGQVDTLSQLREPTMVWSCVVYLFWVILLYSSDGIELMGYPPWYGDFGVLMASMARFVCLHNLSAYILCLGKFMDVACCGNVFLGSS